MNNVSAQKPSNGSDIFRKLGGLFAANSETAFRTQLPDVSRVELKSRCLATVAEILRTKGCPSHTQNQIASIYDEVFADSVCSIYLAAQGLDKPAQLVLRRVLELGLATLYLWDQPHMFWGWKDYDEDLSFTEITAYLSSDAYLKFVSSERKKSSPTQLFDVALARKEYRSLSNAVHGKISTFESPLVDRFRHSDSDWAIHLVRVETIQDLLLNAARGRFAVVEENLSLEQPQIIPLP